MAVALPRPGCLRWVAWVSVFTRKDRPARGKRREVRLALLSWSPPVASAVPGAFQTSRFLLPGGQEARMCCARSRADDMGSAHSDLPRVPQLALNFHL